MNILYEDTALVVLDKPAGLTSEKGVPAALRQRWAGRMHTLGSSTGWTPAFRG